MNLKEEKIMVLKWKGYEHTDDGPDGKSYLFNPKTWESIFYEYLDDFSPESDIRFWPEIWDNINGGDWQVYIFLLMLDHDQDDDKYLHTAPPKDCWKALIGMLELKR